MKGILFLVFFILISPVGFVLRVLGIDYLNRKIDKNEKSYWS